MKNIPYTVGIVISLPHGEILTDKIGGTYNIKDHFSEIMTKVHLIRQVFAVYEVSRAKINLKDWCGGKLLE